MKKVLALVLSLVLVVGVVATLAACGGNEDAQKTDFEYIQEKGELVIGITYFAPMNYFDENNELIGFETEFATAVCEKLGVKAKFQEISWSAKETELAGKSIDCIWNGMTITPEREEAMDISTPYLANKQVLVVKADKLAEIKALESGKGLNIVAEKESAGEGVATSEAFFAEANYTAVDTQSKAFTEVASGIADGCVVDYVCSIGMIGEGTDFTDLVVVDTLNFADEQYGIAFRKGSDVDDKVNAAITELVNDGTLAKIAAKYKLEEQVIAK
jgi:polar amino acid transport system substrate-binding protein